MTDSEYEDWLTRNKIGKEAEEVITEIRTSQPSRRVQGGFSNVSGRYPSSKMGVTIQFESHKVEHPFVLLYETSDDVLEYYDQPPPIQLKYRNNDERRVSVLLMSDN